MTDVSNGGQYACKIIPKNRMQKIHMQKVSHLSAHASTCFISPLLTSRNRRNLVYLARRSRVRS